MAPAHPRAPALSAVSAVSALRAELARTPSHVHALYAADLGVVARRHAEFLAALPRVTPFYAVKCNPDPAVVRVLAALGANFDCASSAEIALVAGIVGCAALADRVVYANPCKQRSHLKNAAADGVRLMTFDGEDELYKIRDVCPDARLLLRIVVDDSAALCPLSSKYGASMDDVHDLLRTAMRLGLLVEGVAFHVGSGCTSVRTYVDALDRSRAVFDIAARLGMSSMKLVDIGGGFPGYDGEAPITFHDIARTVSAKLDELFDSSVQVIAEPGRYYVAAAFSLATRVLALRSGYSSGDPRAVVVGDGVYGSFKDAVLLNVQFTPEAIISGPDNQVTALVSSAEPTYPTTLYGPTMDGRDVIARGVPLPLVRVDDWLVFANMGAYTLSLATCFSNLARPSVHYFDGGD